jgi:hypothetical protein
LSADGLRHGQHDGSSNPWVPLWDDIGVIGTMGWGVEIKWASNEGKNMLHMRGKFHPINPPAFGVIFSGWPITSPRLRKNGSSIG